MIFKIPLVSKQVDSLLWLAVVVSRRTWTPVYRSEHQNYVPKSMKILGKNIVYSNIIRESLVSKSWKVFNFAISLFLSKSNRNCFHVMYPSVFTSCFELASFVRLIYRSWFWCFLNFFQLEVINLRTFKRVWETFWM